MDVIYRPHSRLLSLKWLFLVKNGSFFTFGCYRVCKTLQINPLNIFSVPFRLTGTHFGHCKNKIQFFNFCLFHRLYRGSEVMVGSEDALQFFLKGIFVQEGSSEHILTMVNLKLKSSLFTPCPIDQFNVEHMNWFIVNSLCQYQRYPNEGSWFKCDTDFLLKK